MGDSLKIAKAAATSKATGILAPVEDAPMPESSSLILVPPTPVAAVEEPQATNSIKLDAITLAKLDRLIADFVVAISQLGIKDPKFQGRIADIRKLGDDGIKASTQASARLLERPVGSRQKGGLAVSATLSTSLLDLRRQVDSLDPGHQGDLFGTRKLLGFIPVGDRLQAYFARYESGQGHINAIVAGLEQGKSELTKDNKELEREKENLWQTMDRLRQYIYLAQKLDTSLTERIAMVEARDLERARVLKEDMQLYVRQRIQDLTAQLCASIQGYMSMDVIRHNNLELIRGVDRASTATV
ncbi:MAG: toxic anion resistance protein, partial [Candidatus Limnocylindrales bacterium]